MYFEALALVQEVARHTRDDVLLRHLQRRNTKAADKKLVMAGHTSQALAAEAAADRQKEEQRRRERQELEHRASMEDLAAKTALEEAKAAAAKERLAVLEAARLTKEADDRRALEKQHARANAKWLEVDYPLLLANRLVDWRKSLGPEQVAALRARVHYLLANDRCKTNMVSPHWWTEACPPFTVPITSMLGIDTKRHVVRASKGFEWFIFKKKWGEAQHHEPLWMLNKLVTTLIPDGDYMFGQRHQPKILLHEHDYVLEKTFVHVVWLMSKWLRQTWFPHGIYEWPPPGPPPGP
jgi:hypothetical protein